LIVSLLTLMTFSIPSNETLDSWVIQKNRIECSENGVCFKDNEQISFSSSHLKDTGFFASYEIIYEHDNGHKETFRVFGILGGIYKMNDGFLWEIVN
jgi:hypothetical protein